MMPPRYFKDRFYFLLVAILFLGKKQVFFPFPEEQNSWWRLSLHQESTKAFWWRFSLHQESTKALGGDLAYTKSPPRLLVEI